MGRLDQHDHNPKTVTVCDLLLFRLSQTVTISWNLSETTNCGLLLSRKKNGTIDKRTNTSFTVRLSWFCFSWTFYSMIVLGQLGQEDASIWCRYVCAAIQLGQIHMAHGIFFYNGCKYRCATVLTRHFDSTSFIAQNMATFLPCRNGVDFPVFPRIDSRLATHK